MKSILIRIIVGIMIASSAVVLVGQTAPHAQRGIVSDWAHHHILFPDSQDSSVMARIRRDPRWLQNWYLRHPEAWWPELHCEPGKANEGSSGDSGEPLGTSVFEPTPEPWWPDHHCGPGEADEGSRRDWSVPLVAPTSMSGFEPLFNYSFAIGPDTGYGNLNTTDIGNGEFLGTFGTLTVTGGEDVGEYLLYPGGPVEIDSPSGYFLYDDLLYPSIDPGVDNGGLLFTGNGLEINIFSDGPDDLQFYANSGYNNYGTTFTGKAAPGGGQTYPAKFVFDVTAAPSCSNDYVVIGVPANPASGGQANIIGLNNLYSAQGASTPTPPCGTNGPTVIFAYASGTGQVPASVVISQSGKQIVYVENLLTGSSYFHVLTLGTTGTNGSNATAAVVPGSAGGNNALDQSVLLSPDGGATNQSSTSTAFVVYTPNDANDVAYATTSSITGNGSGHLYKISNVFNGSATPAITWSVPINAVPSTPVYDSVSNKIFFTDGAGRVDYVTDTGTSPSVVYGTVVANGATSENPVIVDSTNQMIYASFNSNGTNALVVQAPTSMASTVSVPVGAGSTIYTGPYGVDFNNAWYIGSGTPLMYVAGTGTGMLPTLYSVGFNSSGVMNTSANTTTAALVTSGPADSSLVTEFYNASLQKDYIFVGVTDNCVATTGGGAGGCVMSLDITGGFPTVNAGSTALAAAGGTSGIIVDNDSSLTEASSIYYATKTAASLVKATQSGLN